jgi:hypothetical protein
MVGASVVGVGVVVGVCSMFEGEFTLLLVVVVRDVLLSHCGLLVFVEGGGVCSVGISVFSFCT